MPLHPQHLLTPNPVPRLVSQLFEDNIYISRGVLAQSNAHLVARAREIVLALGGEIASAREARDLLELS